MAQLEPFNLKPSITIYIVVLITIIFCSPSYVSTQTAIIGKTRHFEFHSNFRINMHHFLYQQAKGDQIAHLEQDGNIIMNIGDDSVIQKLTSEERNILYIALNYYRDHLIDQTLLFDLADMRLWLQNQNFGSPISDTTYSQEYSKILNDFSKVYENRFWELHHEHNKTILQQHLSIIEEFETVVVKRLEQLAGYQWPESKIRIDLSTYANWAGAYTQTQPNFNIIISTLDPFTTGSAFIETVFHEGAHILFNRESEFRARIYTMSKELNMDFPRNLWHAVQFYLCGRLIQDLLQEKNIQHELTMDVKNIFSEYNSKNFRSALEKYYAGNTGIEETVQALLNSPK